MTFTDLMRHKIEERREGRSAAVQAAAEADERFRVHVAPLLAILSSMIETLSADQMFVNAFGRPDLTAKRDDRHGREGSVKLKGRVGTVRFGVMADGYVFVRINPNYVVASALDCTGSYTVEPINGELSDLDLLVSRVLDHLCDFLADIYWSPVGHLLQPERATDCSNG